MERDALAILRDNDGDAIPRRKTPVGRDQGELVIHVALLRSAHAALAQHVDHREAPLIDAVGARGREEQRGVDRPFRVRRAALHVVPHLWQ